jgi:hypothetical protein
MKKTFAILIITLSLSLISVTHAVNISLSIPTTGGATNPCANPTDTTSCSPGDYISGFYQFALLIGGLVAFGAVVYGGLRYMTSTGNPSGQHEAKEWIWSALLGLVLLVGAYLILNTVNPALTHLNLPTLQQTQVGH